MPLSPPESAAQPSQSQTHVFPGAWPLEDNSISPESQSQSTPHLDHVLSFHKRFSWSFSSPTLMPARSPLLSPSISEPSNVYIGKDCDTSATSLSVLADESMSTAYSTDSARENASHNHIPSRLSESTSFPYSPDTTAVYASPEVNHSYVVFPTDYTSDSKPLSTRVTHISRPCSPQSPTIPLPNRPTNLDIEIPTSASSLALSLTPPSPGPIIFAAPSNNSFLLLTPSNSSFSVAALGNRDGTLPVRSQSLSFPLQPVPVQIDSNSTKEPAQMSAIYRSESPLSTSPAFPRKPWRDFAKENSSPRNSFAGRDRPELSPSSTDAQPSSSSRAGSSHALLSAIKTNSLASSQKTRIHSLSLARLPHTRAFSSASFVTNIASPGPSRTLSLRRSSPQLTTQPSFPSRSASPSPLRHRVSEKFNPIRSNSTALFRSVSDRSKTRFSRSFHTANDSLDVANYATAQCEVAFVSDALLPTAEEDSLDRTDNPITEGVLVNYVLDSDNNGSARHSIATKWKKIGGKVKNFVRVVRGSIPLHRKTKCIILAQNDGARIETASNFRVDSALVIQDPQPQSQSPQPPESVLEIPVMSAISGPLDYPFIAPIVHVSAPTPPLASLTKHEVSDPTSAGHSPTLTLRVEPKGRSVPKDDTVSSSPAGSPSKRMRGHSASDEPSTSQAKPKDLPVIFAGIANFGGKIGFDW